jgi:hypothetical protein
MNKHASSQCHLFTSLSLTLGKYLFRYLTNAQLVYRAVLTQGIALALCLAVVTGTHAQASSLTLYPTLPFAPGTEFSVKVSGTTVPVYNAYNSSTDPEVLSYWGTFRICNFAFTGTVTVQVTYNAGPITSFEVSPTSSGISSPTLSGNTITFSMPALPNSLSQKLEVRINPTSNATHKTLNGVQYSGQYLYILADAPETNPPSPTDPTVMYYGTTGTGTNYSYPVAQQTIIINDSTPQTSLYIAPGNVLSANILLKHRTLPFTIHGHGFLQNPMTSAAKSGTAPAPTCWHCIDASDSGTVIEDINIINSVEFNIVLYGNNYVINNVKCLHSCVNTDGFSFYSNASDDQILNSLLVNDDNQVCIGGANNLISGCTFISANSGGAWVTSGGTVPLSCTISNCDVVRPPSSRLFYAYSPPSVDSFLFDNNRFQSGPGDFNLVNYFWFPPVSTGTRTVTWSNTVMPALSLAAPITTGTTTPTDWSISFDNSYLSSSSGTDTLLTSDSCFGVAPGTFQNLGVTTTYSATFSVGLHFDGNGGNNSALSSTTTAGMLGEDYWNNVATTYSNPVSGTLTNLLDNFGAASGVNITYSGPDCWNNYTSTSGLTPDQLLLDGYLDNNSSTEPATVNVSGVSYGTYAVIVYLGTNHSPATGSVALTGASAGNATYYYSVSTTTSGAAGNFAGYQPVTSQTAGSYGVGNYVEFSGVTGTSFKVVDTKIGAGSGITGIQIFADQQFQ